MPFTSLKTLQRLSFPEINEIFSVATSFCVFVFYKMKKRAELGIMAKISLFNLLKHHNLIPKLNLRQI